MRTLIVLIFMSYLFTGAVMAGEVLPEKGCKNNPEIVDMCFSIHGRISVYNGTPSVRIWHVGTKRLYGVLPSENEIMPENIKKQLTLGTSIYGDFLVCPFTEAKAGYMQNVCIESALNLKVVQDVDGKAESNVLKIENKCDDNLSEWLECNNPRVIKYLRSLTKNNVGEVLKGVLLTDGKMAMQGYTFLGEAENLGKGIHLYIFDYKKLRMAYVWVDKNGNKLPLPECSKEISFESAYVLSGDVYTWKAIQPGDGVVQVMCVTDSWLRKANIPVEHK